MLRKERTRSTEYASAARPLASQLWGLHHSHCAISVGPPYTRAAAPWGACCCSSVFCIVVDSACGLLGSYVQYQLGVVMAASVTFLVLTAPALQARLQWPAGNVQGIKSAYSIAVFSPLPSSLVVHVHPLRGLGQ
jgi:hypothetical protein